MKRAMVYVVLIVVSLGALMSGAWARSEQTKQFVHEAAKAGIAEVKLGQMATEQAVSPDVQQFGQRMVSDHTKANEKLKTIAQDKDIEIFGTPKKMGEP